jgi:hypothetical protein
MKTPPGGRLHPAPRVLCKEIDGEAVLLDLETENYFGLNETAARFWSLATVSGTIGEAFETMLTEYDVPREVLERDLDAIVLRWVELGLARIEHG